MKNKKKNLPNNRKKIQTVNLSKILDLSRGEVYNSKAIEIFRGNGYEREYSS